MKAKRDAVISTRAILSAAVILAAVGATSCGTSQAAQRGSRAKIVYPPPPAQAVIEWIGSYSSASDVGAGQGAISRILIGDEERQPTLVAPTNLAIAPDGAFFVVDQQLDAVVILDPARKRFEVFRGDAAGRIVKPVAVAFGPDGSFYVSEAGARAVLCFDDKLKFRSFLGGPKLLERPTGIAVSPDGKRVAVCDTPKDVVFVLSTSDGSVVNKLGIDGGGRKAGEFQRPYTVAFDDDGFLYVSDYLNFRIQTFGPDGSFEGEWGTAGDRPGDLNRPRGLNVDSARGVIYEVDGAFQLVQMFNLDGELLMWFASPGEGPGQLALPTGISRRGDLVAIADTMNRRIQVFRFLGVPGK